MTDTIAETAPTTTASAETAGVTTADSSDHSTETGTTAADTANGSTPTRKNTQVENLVIRFAGDSGDGMQLTGDRFTNASAVFGNDLATLPDFPAEIRAPAGTLYGVSAFQIHVSEHDITTPGDAPNALVAMNPAALKTELPRLEIGSTVIINTDSFTERNLEKADYESNPLEDGSLDNFNAILVPMTSLTKEACKAIGVKPRDADRSKNFFALGLVSWLYSRPTEPTLDWIQAKFKGKEQVIAANTAAFKAGNAFGETAELFDYTYEVRPAKLEPGTYTNINGTTALAWGLVAASQQAKRPLFLGSYPITPASDILHELSERKNFGIRTLQAEDEIASVCAAIGASYGGHIGITTTSGPGLALKGEAIGLAISLELPLVVVNVQRGGPSTGLPTKTEASDLMIAMFGRHGESPVPVLAAYSPSHCFTLAIEAVRIAIKYQTPVILLSDGYIANGTEPWKLPDVSTLPDISTDFVTEPNHMDEDGNEHFWPYKRDPETLATPWVIPGTPNLMHRKGGLEKADGTGNVSYDPLNHELMTHYRADKIAGIAKDIPSTWVNTHGKDPHGQDIPDENPEDHNDLLVLGWGSTWGAITSALKRVRSEGHKVHHAHLIHLNPFPEDLGEVLSRYKNILIPEMNNGQLSQLIQAKYLVKTETINKIRGVPFSAGALTERMLEILNG